MRLYQNTSPIPRFVDSIATIKNVSTIETY